MKPKKKCRNYDWESIGYIIGIILFVIIIIFCIVMMAYCFITYGNKPIGEIPSWALFWMFKS